MSFGPSILDSYWRAAAYVDKIRLQSPPTSPSSNPPSSSWWSTSRPLRRSVWRSRSQCCCGQIKSSS